MFVEKHPFVTGIQIPVYIPPRKKLNPTEFFLKTNKKNYSVMSIFVNQILIDTEVAYDLPYIELTSVPILKETSDSVMMDKLKIKEGKIMSPVEICQTIAHMTSERRSMGKDFPADSSGIITLVGYVPCHDGQLRAVTIYYENHYEQWFINCHEISQWTQEIKLLVKKTDLLSPGKN